MSMEDSGPSIESVKPNKKEVLTGEHANIFSLSLPHHEIQGADINNIHFQRYEKGNNCPNYFNHKFNTTFPNVSSIEEVLSISECEYLCKTMDSCNELTFWNESNRDSAITFRNAFTVEVNQPDLASLLWERIQSHYSPLTVTISEADIDSNDDLERDLVGTWYPSGVNSTLLFAKYPSGGHFSPHTDGRVIQDFDHRSFFSVILFLNDIPSNYGGGTRFFTKEALQHLILEDGQWISPSDYVTCEVSAARGRMVVFNQSQVHEGIRCVTPYCKYIIRTDIMFERTPALLTQVSDVEAYKMVLEAEELSERGFTDQAIQLFKKAYKLSPQLRQLHCQ